MGTHTHAHTRTVSVLEAALSVAIMNPTVITLAVVVITLWPTCTHTHTHTRARTHTHTHTHTHTNTHRDACLCILPLHTHTHMHRGPARCLLIHHATPHGVACGSLGMRWRWKDWERGGGCVGGGGVLMVWGLGVVRMLGTGLREGVWEPGWEREGCEQSNREVSVCAGENLVL